MQEKTASFFCLSRTTGEVLWERKSFGEQWWIGIETVFRNTMFLHKYATPDLPQHRSILAVDVQTGELLWSNENLRFVATDAEFVYGVKDTPTGNELFQLECRTGKIVRSLQDGEHLFADGFETFAHSEGQPEFPVPMDSSDLKTVTRDVIRSLVPEALLIGSVEVIESDPVVIFNYHERMKDSSDEQLRVNNIMSVLDKRTNNVVFNETLNANAPTMIPESFFMQCGILYFIKERSVLSAVRLPDHAVAG